MTLTLHHAPDFASTIVRFALEELELPHTLAIVDIEGGALASPEYRQVNPVGLIPALEALAAAQEARVETPVVARAEGLGAHPFTRPDQPNPPEGSVL